MRRFLTIVLRYASDAVGAWAVQVVWVWVRLAIPPVVEPGAALSLRFGVAVLFSIVGGFVPAVLLMFVPWLVIAMVFRRVEVRSVILHAAAGALGMLSAGCVGASLAWKPPFIEDQTFFEGMVVTLDERGLCLAFAGAVFGTIFRVAWCRHEALCRLP